MNAIKRFLTSKKMEWLLVGSVLLIAAIAHGYNMFNFPYYENDEGTYMSQAWSLVTQGQLAPYTYWYDHAPFGWLMIAAWSWLTGGFFTFGFSINSGRALMLVLHVVASIFVYFIGKKLTGSKWVGIISVLIFSLSPLAIYFQRRVLLDNIMTFWMLFSLVLILYNNNKLRYLIASAIAFGFAILSKENAVFLLPIFIYIMYMYTHTKQKVFGLVKWVAIVSVTVSTYFIFALLQKEFFPSGTFLGGNDPHVSLLETIGYQAGREGGGIVDPETSYFWRYMRIWLSEDAALIYAGIAATCVNLLIGIRGKIARIVSLLAVSLWIFLARGGLVIEFYILPLIPILALNIAVTVWYLTEGIKKITPAIFSGIFKHCIFIIFMVAILISCAHFSTNIRGSYNIYRDNQTQAQIDAVNWILANGSEKNVFVIDDYGYVDLHAKNQNSFKYAEWYWKVDLDPEIKNRLSVGGQPKIDFIATTPQMEHDIIEGGLQITGNALKNSQLITRFEGQGWSVSMWGVKTPERVIDTSWISYKKNFIKEGRVIDPQTNNSTTSEGQSYALLRAVWLDDKEAFNQIYTWTKENLLQKNGMHAWKYENGKIVEKGFATDADQDIALALLFASQKWGNATYRDDAKKLLNSIWIEAVVNVRNEPYLIAGSWADKDKQFIVNPSYLSPASYKIFAQADRSHDWKQLSDSSYRVLSSCTSIALDDKHGVLPPDWCAIEKSTLKASQPSEEPRGVGYGYDAIRVPWRIALDYQWFRDPKAKQYLATLTILSDEWNTSNKLAATYTHDGRVSDNYESVAAYGGTIGYFIVMDPKAANVLYREKILKKFYEDKGRSYFDDPNNYYTQNWGWFGTALANHQLPNLWISGQLTAK